MRHVLLSLLVLAWVLVPGGGCFALMGVSAGVATDYVRPIVLVVDGEIGAPIAGARVHAPAHSGASTDSSTTDAAGRAKIRVAEHVGSLWAEASGYMSGPAQSPAGDGATVRIALFRPPEPIAGLTIPAAYHGVLRVKEGAEPAAPTAVPTDWPRGQREFYTQADPQRLTELLAPPKLLDGQPYHTRVFAAQLDDGTPLRYENPVAATGTSGEHLSFLPNIRDRVPPRGDGVALFKVGEVVNLETTPASGHTVYVVGLRAEAAVEQQRLQNGAAIRTPTSRPTRGYLLYPTPLDVRALPQSIELSPRRAR